MAPSPLVTHPSRQKRALDRNRQGLMNGTKQVHMHGAGERVAVKECPIQLDLQGAHRIRSLRPAAANRGVIGRDALDLYLLLLVVADQNNTRGSLLPG